MIETPQITPDLDLEKYFTDVGLGELVAPSKARDQSVNELVIADTYKPELKDLYRLHRFILDFKRTTVLEFGVGWSTLVMANALAINRGKYHRAVANLRRNNPFEIHAVDNERNYLEVAKARISATRLAGVHFHCSTVEMTTFNGRIATQFAKLPLISPDFIYLDGPDQFNVQGSINGINTAHNDMMPMACDLLRFEHFLTPGTIIVVDGRGANARFLRCNFQRGWTYNYEERYDQHVFYLDEPPLGEYNKRQLNFYSSKT